MSFLIVFLNLFWCLHNVIFTFQQNMTFWTFLPFKQIWIAFTWKLFILLFISYFLYDTLLYYIFIFLYDYQFWFSLLSLSLWLFFIITVAIISFVIVIIISLLLTLLPQFLSFHFIYITFECSFTSYVVVGSSPVVAP